MDNFMFHPREGEEFMVKMKKLLVSLVSIFMMMFMIIPTVSAKEQTSTVAEDPRESVMMITVGYEDDNGVYKYAAYGSCFLINNEYVLTCNHVVSIKDWSEGDWNKWSQIIKSTFKLDDLKKDDSHIKVEIYVNRDMKVEGTVDANVISSDLDFALVKLSTAIYDRGYVALGDSDSLSVKQDVYALGYPNDSIEADEYNTKEDVSTIDGTISKLNAVIGNSKFIEHTANIEGGNSGGPLVDENDNVIGVNTIQTNSKNYATPINKIISGLKTFGIDYTEGEGGSTIGSNVADPTPDPEPTPDVTENLANLKSALDNAKGLDTSKYTDDSVTALNSAITDAESVYNTSGDADEIDAATEKVKAAVSGLEEKKSNTMLFVGIGVVAAVIVIAVVVIVMNNNKKKKAQPAQPTYQAPQMPTPPSPQPSSVGAGETALLDNGAGETTLLDSGAGETTLLNGAASNAYLIRKKNGEKIVINHQNFKLGKERAKVDYCISDNSSVSRVHCEILRQGSDYYVVDKGSTNFTFVNGIQIGSNKETLLADSSSLKLSDEEFEFHQG